MWKPEYKKVIITLTTVPTRLISDNDLNFKSCIKSLVEQSYENYEIHINIPYVNKSTGLIYQIPEWLSTYSDKIKIFRVDDMGPSTKLVYTVYRIQDPETIIIVVDDDFIYHPDLVKAHIENQNKFPEYCVGYDGYHAVEKTYFDFRDTYVNSQHRDCLVKFLQHFKSVSYKRRYFEDDFMGFIKYYWSWHDDLLIGAYFNWKNRGRMVTFHSSDPEFKTYDEWYNKGGVLSFPIIKDTIHDAIEGCRIFKDNHISDNYDKFSQFL